MFDVTRIRSLGDKKVVRYNKDRAPIGENEAKLKSFIGSATHYHVPIKYTSWKSVPAKLKDKIFTTVEVYITLMSLLYLIMFLLYGHLIKYF